MVYAVIDTNIIVSSFITRNPSSSSKPHTDYHYSPIYHSTHSTKRHKELLSHKCLQIHPTYTTDSFSNGFLK